MIANACRLCFTLLFLASLGCNSDQSLDPRTCGFTVSNNTTKYFESFSLDIDLYTNRDSCLITGYYQDGSATEAVPFEYLLLKGQRQSVRRGEHYDYQFSLTLSETLGCECQEVFVHCKK